MSDDVPEFVRLARSRVFPLHIPDRDDHSGGMEERYTLYGLGLLLQLPKFDGVTN